MNLYPAEGIARLPKALMETRTVEQFFDREYRNYAIYTITSRAIPSLVDGFKPSQRKIAFAANLLWKTGNEKPLKVFQLGGQAASLAFYHHGSLDDTIIGMTQDFKNAMPVFQGIGQFGSLRSPGAGAPRYVGVRFNDNFRRLYKDFELTTPQEEEGEKIEPKFFLPIIPTVLLNGGAGIAVGFATYILNRHPLTLIDAVSQVLKDGTCTSELTPWINGFHGEVESLEKNEGRSWRFHGAYTIVNTTTVEVTEIPPSFTYEKYEAHLESLLEKGEIRSYEDSSSDRVRYTLKFARAHLSLLVDKDQLAGVLKLGEAATENITTLDENGNLKIFQSPQDLVVYFTEFRLGYYAKRKAHLLQALDTEIQVLGGRSSFVKGVIDGKVKLANCPRKDIEAQVQALGIIPQDGKFDYLLSMPIYSLTQEKYQDLVKKLQERIATRQKTEATSPKEFYLADLADLKKHLVSKGWDKTVKVETSKVVESPEGPVKDWLSETAEPKKKPFDILAEILKGGKD